MSKKTGYTRLQTISMAFQHWLDLLLEELGNYLRTSAFLYSGLIESIQGLNKNMEETQVSGLWIKITGFNNSSSSKTL